MAGANAAIAGIGETAFVRATPRTTLDMTVEAARKAVADAGLGIADIDGFVSCGSVDHVDELVFALGVADRGFSAATSVVAGTATVGSGLQLAQLAVQSGLAKHVLVYYAIKCSKPGGPRTTHLAEPLKVDLEMPVGYFGQPAYFAVLANRYAHEFGLSEEELASVALTYRKWAVLNPDAQKREPMDMEGYRKSPMVARPMRVADCCLMTDGAGAYLVTTLERARDLAKAPAVVAGIGIASNPEPMSTVLTQRHDLLDLPGRRSAEVAYAAAGITAADVNVAQVYDCFSISAILQTEMLGFCEKGEGGRFYHAGHAAPGGKMPVNTSGGHMSGGYVPGINLLIEGVRQLRGERGEAQVAGASVCAVAGLGGNTHATTILTRDQ